ncbi:glycoside hydrolase family 43 protein [Sediminicola luteus]|nr:glycoside hydrolase family 43 protein [Sediminicola luteus]
MALGQQTNDSIAIADIRIRDPFILTDTVNQQYYMYAQTDNRLGFRGQDNQLKGVEVYTSKDLKTWSAPKTVLRLPDPYWARHMVWAPEVHANQGKYYLFVTLTSSDTLPAPKGMESKTGWPKFHKRGTQIFVSDSPTGPFRDFENKPHTPTDWMALDGTLFVEDETPYMIFCHEWVQIVDGSMDYVQLSPDLSTTIGQPIKMFNASEAAWSTSKKNKVTDGCYLYRTKTGKLLMIWSSFGEAGYAIGIAESESGKLAGPWKQQPQLLFQKNGGHGMLFHNLQGQLTLALHQPNGPRGKERLKLFAITNLGDTLSLKNKASN